MELNTRMRKFIAVVASVAANCQLSLQYYSKKAQDAGADELQIAEAVEVAPTTRKRSDEIMRNKKIAYLF